ncbi:MAG TPA: TIGR00730 family Rossman fold protein [Candidatus Polarisedimenticolaceae bacterium]|nr:TIGR00730 family Rossman fold protein [Candidatus Polarisedimenticolaceae bacterium]
MNVCVFCAANNVDARYSEPAARLAQLLGEQSHTLIWGGDDSGLMKVMADGVSESGGRIVGISVELLRHKARQQADEMIFTSDIAERKALMIERADVLVLMVGGIGALSEATDVLVLRKHKKHTKPLIVLNTAGFYRGLQQQLEHMNSEGFLPLKLEEVIYFAETPGEVLEYMQKEQS